MNLQVYFLAALVFAVVAAIIDWRTGHIPHQLTLGVLVVATLVHTGSALRGRDSLASDSLTEAGLSLGGALVCALVPILLYRQNAIGGGDVGLFAALGALLHPLVGIEVEMFSFCVAAILAPAKLAYDGKLMSTLRNAGKLAVNSVVPEGKRKAVDATALSWFRLGPCVVVGVLLSAVLRTRH
jgi:prepilin peptidase CpaA